MFPSSNSQKLFGWMRNLVDHRLTILVKVEMKKRVEKSGAKTPKTAKALGFRPKAFMVAGAGFEPTTFGL
jgi:hypothetical protein